MEFTSDDKFLYTPSYLSASTVVPSFHDTPFHLSDSTVVPSIRADTPFYFSDSIVVPSSRPDSPFHFSDSIVVPSAQYNQSFRFRFHPDSTFYLSDFYPPQGTGPFELLDNSSIKADDDSSSALASDQHVGGSSAVNIRDAGVMNIPPADGGLNKPFGVGEQFSGGHKGYGARDSGGSTCCHLLEWRG